MQLFQQDNSLLTEINKDPFKLEIDIQKLVEHNLDKLFELEFVSSEFAVENFRLDSLAFDPVSNSFVIVEYKKGSSYSVVDQGYTYLSVMLNNKADFVLEYNVKTENNLKKTDIEWSSSKVIFISPSFNSYQKHSINFKDMPFELWEIKRFEKGVISIDQISSTSQESIEKITPASSKSKVLQVSKEVKPSSETELSSKLSDSMLPVWQQFKEKLLELQGTEIKTTTGYLAIRYESKVLLFIYFKGDTIEFNLMQGTQYPDGRKSKKFFDLDDPKKIAEQKSTKWREGNLGPYYKVIISHENDLDYSLFLIKQKYKNLS